MTTISSKLDASLRHLLKAVDVETLTKVSTVRLATTALPNIKCIELVSDEVFSQHYVALYLSMFKPVERERFDLIVDRLQKEFAHQRAGLASYHIVGLRDRDGSAIGAAHFSVLPLQGEKLAVPYLQYIYIRQENRRQYMADLLHTMILAVATADANKVASIVPFTLFETNPPLQANPQSNGTTTVQTAEIHAKAGAIALMLRDVMSGKQISSHVQPGLEADDPPLSIIWAMRASPAVHLDFNIEKIGKNLIAAYYQSLRDEGFPEDNIQLAETLVARRCENRRFELIPIHEVIAVAHHPNLNDELAET